jgi:membrane-associated phospholipid phosphatase
MKLNTFIIIILICIYHSVIQNRIEKAFFKTYFDSNLIKRPTKKCLINKSDNCIGMPSGHSETVTLFASLLYFYNIIPLWVSLFIILIFSFQRVNTNKHSTLQVVIGILIGYLYAILYKLFNLSLYSFSIILSIGLSLLIFTHFYYSIIILV